MPSSKRVASSGRGRGRGRGAGKRSNAGVYNPTANVLDSSMVHPPAPAIATTRGRGRGATKRAKPSAKTSSHESDGSLISAAEAMAPVARPPSPTISLAFPLQSGQVVTSGDRVASGQVEGFGANTPLDGDGVQAGFNVLHSITAPMGSHVWLYPLN